VVELLKRGMPYLVLEKFGQAKELPMNKTQAMKFRRYEHLPLATTPLIEGVTPTSIKLAFTDITAILRQYGKHDCRSKIFSNLLGTPYFMDNQR